jgi:glycosyltransferase involved in cell wall biosynthesis
MSTYPLVTIMIPTYKQAELLPVALESALGQDYEHLEVVVADDCSPDGTESVVRKYLADPRVKYFRNSTNLGRVGNYKRSLEKYARGEWVANLDADDCYTDLSFISKAISRITAGDIRKDGKEDRVVFLQAGHTVKGPDGAVLRRDIPSISGDFELMAGTSYFIDFHHFSHLATVFNREMAIALDFYRYNILSSDMESFLRLALHGQVILMKSSVGDWIHHGANVSQHLDLSIVEMNMLRIEAPFVYAKSLGLFPFGDLLHWKNRLTKDYVQSYLILSLKNKGKLDGYLRHVLKYYPQFIPGLVIPKALAYALISKIRRFFGINKNGSSNRNAS